MIGLKQRAEFSLIKFLKTVNGLRRGVSDQPIQSIGIVSQKLTGGLGQDCEILKHLLKGEGLTVTHHLASTRSWQQTVMGRQVADLIIHIEYIHRRWVNSAPKNILVPNQEWILGRNRILFPLMDRIACKTRHAVELFEGCGSEVQFMGFRTESRNIEGSERDPAQYLHIAGLSPLKGTECLLEVWARHPEWPKLTVVTRLPVSSDAKSATNIEIIDQHLPQSDLKTLQNLSATHICTSLSEGFGHYILEALSTGALVLTTDAPPMNELITDGSGIRVSFQNSAPRMQGYDFFVDPTDLERKIQVAIDLSSSERDSYSSAAKARYTEICDEFECNWREVLLSF